MTEKQLQKWRLHNFKIKNMLLKGLEYGSISQYSEALIQKLRTIYDGGLPASIILLSKGLSDGHCYERALLLARAFLDTDEDVHLLYGSIESLRLNPKYISYDDPLYADHCFVERITPQGQHLIYDTSSGFIFTKEMYWLMERPRIRETLCKQTIIKLIQEQEEQYPLDYQRCDEVAPFIIPMIELTYSGKGETYAEINLLQREVELFKKLIDYDTLCEIINDDMKCLGLKKHNK